MSSHTVSVGAINFLSRPSSAGGLRSLVASTLLADVYFLSAVYIHFPTFAVTQRFILFVATDLAVEKTVVFVGLKPKVYFVLF